MRGPRIRNLGNLGIDPGVVSGLATVYVRTAAQLVTALAAASSNTVIEMLPGTYNLTETLNFRGKTKVVLNMNGSIIQPSSDVSYWQKRFVVDMISSVQCSIYDGTIQSTNSTNKPAGGLILGRPSGNNSSNVQRFEHVNIAGVWDFAALVESGADVNLFTNCTFTNTNSASSGVVYITTDAQTTTGTPWTRSGTGPFSLYGGGTGVGGFSLDLAMGLGTSNSLNGTSFIACGLTRQAGSATAANNAGDSVIYMDNSPAGGSMGPVTFTDCWFSIGGKSSATASDVMTAAINYDTGTAGNTNYGVRFSQCNADGWNCKANMRILNTGGGTGVLTGLELIRNKWQAMERILYQEDSGFSCVLNKVAIDDLLFTHGDAVSADGYDWGYSIANVSLTAKTVSAVDTGTETLTTSTAHGFSADDKVVFRSSGAVPATLVAGTQYFVLAAGLTSTQFRVSATSGGAAINLTDAGTGTITVERADRRRCLYDLYNVLNSRIDVSSTSLAYQTNISGNLSTTTPADSTTVFTAWSALRIRSVSGNNDIIATNVGSITSGVASGGDVTYLDGVPGNGAISSLAVRSNATPWGGPTRQTFTVTNGTTDRTYNANASSVDELADIIYTLLNDLQNRGIVTVA